jgi:hypothetical protein
VLAELLPPEPVNHEIDNTANSGEFLARQTFELGVGACASARVYEGGEKVENALRFIVRKIEAGEAAFVKEGHRATLVSQEQDDKRR